MENLNKVILGFVAGIIIGSAVTYSVGRKTESPATDPETATHSHTGANESESLSARKPAAPAMAPSADETAIGDAKTYSQRLDTALSIRSRHDRLREFLILLAEMERGDGPAVKSAIAKLDRQGGQHPAEWSAFVDRWGEVNGQAAADYHLKRIDEQWAKGSIRGVFAGWARTDADGAVDFINSAEMSKEVADTSILGLIAGLGDDSLEAAVGVAIENIDHGDSRLASRAMETVAERAIRQGGTETLLETFNDLPNPDWKSAAFGHVWWRLQHADRTAASDWLLANAQSEWRNPTQYSQTIARMANDAPSAALNWSAQLPSDLASDSKRSVFRNWQSSAPGEAEAWLKEQPEQLTQILTGEQ